MNAEMLKGKISTWRRRRASRIDWRRRHARVFALHPELTTPRSVTAEQQHRALWRPLGARFSLDTYRVCANLSGNDDPRYVPEEVFVSELQGYLYPNPWVRFLADKNVYDRWFGTSHPGARELFPGGFGGQTPRRRHDSGTSHGMSCFPGTYLRKVGGRMLGPDYNTLTENDVRAICEELSYPVVCKPSLGSFGGRNISFCQDKSALISALDNGTDLVVQERIRPHDFFAQFGEVGLNTIRVYCYRPTATGRFHILNAALRMGRGGSLDNETAGGIVCHLTDSAGLNAYAVDKYAGVYREHPDRRIRFTGLAIPDPGGLHDLALSLASCALGARLVGLDMCMDCDGKWRCVEINLGIQTIRFAQYAGHPFFGEYTDEVIDGVLAGRSTSKAKRPQGKPARQEQNQ